MVLLHEVGWPNWLVWERWEEMHQGRVAVLCHLKAGVDLAPTLPGAAAIRARLLSTRLRSEWGCLSLTEAILDGAGEALARCPLLRHVAICSGHDVPVARVPAGALRAGATLFTDFRFGYAFEEQAQQEVARELARALRMADEEARAWGSSLVFHHTWKVMARWAYGARLLTCWGCVCMGLVGVHAKVWLGLVLHGALLLR